MKKLIFSIAFLGLIAANTTAQNSENHLDSENPENEIPYEIEYSEDFGLLSDFLLYIVGRQRAEHRHQSTGEIGFGLFAQSGLIVGGIRNSEATMRGVSESTQFGFGMHFRWRRHALVTTLGWSVCNFQIRNGLKNNILGDYSQFPLEILPDLSSSATSETFNRLSRDAMIGYRFIFHRHNNNRYFAELGVFNTDRVRNRYSARFVGTDYIDIDFSYTRAAIFNRSDTGIQAAVGWNHLSLYARYRLTDPFRNFDATLPRLTIGLRVAI